MFEFLFFFQDKTLKSVRMALSISILAKMKKKPEIVYLSSHLWILKPREKFASILAVI